VERLESVPGSEKDTAVFVTMDEFAVYCLKRTVQRNERGYVDRVSYCVDDGLHNRPRCTKVPPGPQPTRNDRPNARPASTTASSTPFTMEAELSTLAYLREGRKGTGSIS